MKPYYITATIWNQVGEDEEDIEVIEAEEIASFETLEAAVEYLNQIDRHDISKT